MQRRTKIGVAIAGAGLVSCCVGGAALWAFRTFTSSEEADRRVRIVAWAPGQSASDVDARVCAPIVDALLRVEGVAEPWSEAREGACVEPANDPSSIATVMVGRIPIGQVATVELTTRPPALFRHGSAPASPILVSVEGEDEASFDAISTAAESIELPAGVTIAVERR